MSWWLQELYSPGEVILAILLAALPMSQISQIILGIIEEKTGIEVHKQRNGHTHTHEQE